MQCNETKDLIMNITSNIQCLFPHNVNFEVLTSMRATLPFADDVIEALNALSAALLKDKRSRQYPDVVTFAFFIRRSNLLALKNNFQLYGYHRDFCHDSAYQEDLVCSRYSKNSIFNLFHSCTWRFHPR